MLPQIIYIFLMAFALSFALFKHGEPQTGKYSFWITLTSVIIQCFILWWGGFFNPLFK